MQIYIKIHLFGKFFTFSHMNSSGFRLDDTRLYKLLGLQSHRISNEEVCEYIKFTKNGFKLSVNAYFLQPFVQECVMSKVYRLKVLTYIHKLKGNPNNGTVFLKLILEPPDKEIIDYLWNERMLRLIWSRVEIENAFSWLSTLGGAYSALGDYFEYCAEEAGRISVRQYKLSKMLGDESLAARSRLYSALSHAQKGKLKLSRQIVRKTANFAVLTHDKRLLRMCQGVWAKLKYLRLMENNSKKLMKTNINGKWAEGDV